MVWHDPLKSHGLKVNIPHWIDSSPGRRDRQGAGLHLFGKTKQNKKDKKGKRKKESRFFWWGKGGFGGIFIWRFHHVANNFSTDNWQHFSLRCLKSKKQSLQLLKMLSFFQKLQMKLWRGCTHASMALALYIMDQEQATHTTGLLTDSGRHIYIDLQAFLQAFVAGESHSIWSKSTERHKKKEKETKKRKEEKERTAIQNLLTFVNIYKHNAHMVGYITGPSFVFVFCNWFQWNDCSLHMLNVNCGAALPVAMMRSVFIVLWNAKYSDPRLVCPELLGIQAWASWKGCWKNKSHLLLFQLMFLSFNSFLLCAFKELNLSLPCWFLSSKWFNKPIFYLDQKTEDCHQCWRSNKTVTVWLPPKCVHWALHHPCREKILTPAWILCFWFFISWSPNGQRTLLKWKRVFCYHFPSQISHTQLDSCRSIVGNQNVWKPRRCFRTAKKKKKKKIFRMLFRWTSGQNKQFSVSVLLS